MSTQSCNCIEEIKKKILDQANEKGKAVKGYKIKNSYFEHSSFYPKLRLYSNFIIDYTFEKKDGNESRVQHQHAAILYSFCPFCGQKLQE